jgi:hypothetical protein
MKMEFKWAVEKVNTVGENNLIQTVFLSCTATKEGVSETHQTTRVLSPSDTFIAFDQLTEQQVLDWCLTPQVTEVKDKTGALVETITKNLKDDIETFISANVEHQLAQRASSPALPWVVAELNENIAATAAQGV